MSDLQRPLPPSLGARAARDSYLAENGFTVETYESKGSTVTVLGVDFYRPLTPDAQRAIRRHDLHHVVTGFGTDLIGEAEVSAWELGRGLRGIGLYVRGIIWSVALLGVLLAPRRVWRAYRAAGGGDCLFARDDYEALLALSVGELRAQLGIPPAGIAQVPRKLHGRAPRAPLGSSCEAPRA